jgi:hypothetical protein
VATAATPEGVSSLGLRGNGIAIANDAYRTVYSVGTWECSEMRNVFEAILEFGHDEDFVPRETNDFKATSAPAGSAAKIAALARRVEMGLPLWHPDDRADYSGLTGAIRPRE